MYKLRKGVELPKEFKIKVNADESRALQEYLLTIGVNALGFGDNVSFLNYPYVYRRPINTCLTADCDSPCNKYKFEKDKLTQIQFNDYLYLDFPEKWCIEVTEDNYKELDVWMHRNWKNYQKYTDKWSITFTKGINEGKRLYSHSDMGWTGSFIKNGFELITTDQFRGKFGNLKVHDVEFVNQSSDKVAEAINRSLDNDVEKEILSSKAKYYKEKSDRLRKEKFEMSKDKELRYKQLENIIDHKNNDVEQLKQALRQQVNGIELRDKQIARLVKVNETLIKNDTDLKKIISDQQNDINVYKSVIDKVKSDIEDIFLPF